jgi:ribosomal protein S18 acetylase RimI-like enzyme
MLTDLLARIERYYDAVPRSAARVEQIGPFSLFVRTDAGWPYYARPRLGEMAFVAADVARVCARQQALEVPQQFEWVADVSPGLRAAIEAAGLIVHTHPLLAMPAAAFRPAGPPDSVRIRLVEPDGDDLATIGAVADLAFGAPGTAIGPVGLDELGTAARLGEAAIEAQRQRLRSGRTITAVALLEGWPVATGSHQPVDGVTEIVGVATLPAFRRRGLGAAVTSRLVEDALARGIETIFLSADDDAVARVYQRLGFERLATACIAESPADAD